MNKNYKAITACLILIFFACKTFGQQQPLVDDIKKKHLTDFSKITSQSFVISHNQAVLLAKSHNWDVRIINASGRVKALEGVNALGFPQFLTTHNVTSAQTTQTNTVQPGGLLGLDLSGSSPYLNNKLAIWDGGSVYAAHQEFANKTITLNDGIASIDHATHVAGTMIAQGINPPAQGMSFNAATLISYDFDNDIAKMSAAAPGLLLSNHSYGDIAGWDLENSIYTWYGLPGDTVDYTFGYYDTRAQSWDKIAYNAPYYLIVESSGNAHDITGPPVGGDYYGYTSRTDQTIIDKGPRPADISSNNSYDVISTTGNAKNDLTVGAVGVLPNGPVKRSDVKVSYFSSWGPTDDGRVKPDIVGMGENVVSTVNFSPTSYATESGTSMSCPNVTGSLYLLQEYYYKKYGTFMHSATLKGLACGTAFDAGNVGPDYIYGWGLLNMKLAAEAIIYNGQYSFIHEDTLQQGQKKTFDILCTLSGPLTATIAWTDPEGTPSPAGTINDRTPKLVNDLDLRVANSGKTYFPWVLDPDNPSKAATTGDNIRDNVEQVLINNAKQGQTYSLTISHKGGLQSGIQAYSVIVTAGKLISTSVSYPDNGLVIYPVPANERLNITYGGKIESTVSVSLINSTGRIVYNASYATNGLDFSTVADVSSMPTGIYILKFTSGTSVYNRKIVIIR